MPELPATVQALMDRGVNVIAPHTVSVDPSIRAERIAATVTLHPGCRLRGEALSIGPGCDIGNEAPVTLEDCQLEGNVKLGGGYFCGVTLRTGVQVASGAHMRSGTLLEEEVTCGHAVGLKQTILLPYVTTGSLVNFCDCLMAGGTGRSNHSEVGSSYVHFNFRPQRDKATPSLVGDVPRGVMLDQPPIFLGGQGGLVGPARLEYGTVLGAGVICRHDVLQPGRLIVGGPHAMRQLPYQAPLYGDISRLLRNNFIYIGNLHALLQWHRHVRVPFARDAWQQACQVGALKRLREAIDERLRQLDRLHGNLQPSLDLARAQYSSELPAAPFGLQLRFIAAWPRLRDRLTAEPAATESDRERDRLLRDFSTLPPGGSYLDALRGLNREGRAAGTGWLQTVVDHYADACPQG